MDSHTINFELDNSFIPKYNYKLPFEIKINYTYSAQNYSTEERVDEDQFSGKKKNPVNVQKLY